jgi:enolase
MRIVDVYCKTILDSRGEPTIEVQMQGEHASVMASVPSGKSRGIHEAVPAPALEAVEHCHAVSKLICSRVFADQKEFDAFLIARDGTKNKHRLGANVMLALSLAFARLWAQEYKKELATSLRDTFHTQHPSHAHSKDTLHLVCNVINGGAHVDPSEEWVMRNGSPRLDIQEFQVIPMVDDVAMALSVATEFYAKLGRVLTDRFSEQDIFLGDEAGYVAPFENNEDALETLYELIEKHHYPLRIGIDAAASQFFAHERYTVGGNSYSSVQLLEYYTGLKERYDLYSIEDPFFEEDFLSFARLEQRWKKSEGLIITDDLTTTNHLRLERAIERSAGNAILVKPNQIGTLSETFAVVARAYQFGWKVVVSHRSGETMDDFIADLAVAVRAWGLKSGAPGAPERMSKYQRAIQLLT